MIREEQCPLFENQETVGLFFENFEAQIQFFFPLNTKMTSHKKHWTHEDSVSAIRLEGGEFDTWSGQTIGYIIGIFSSLRLAISIWGWTGGGGDKAKIREHRCALAAYHPSGHHRSHMKDKFHILWDVTISGDQLEMVKIQSGQILL